MEPKGIDLETQYETQRIDHLRIVERHCFKTLTLLFAPFC